MMLLACKKFTANDVTEFLNEIELSQYAMRFKAEEINGEALLEADQDLLADLGVSDSSHQVKIIQKFRKKLKGMLLLGTTKLIRIIQVQTLSAHYT